MRTAVQPGLPLRLADVELERGSDGGWTIGNLKTTGSADDVLWLVASVRVVSTSGEEANFTLSRDQFLTPARLNGNLVHCPISARLPQGELAEVSVAVEYLGIAGRPPAGLNATGIQEHLLNRYRPVIRHLDQIQHSLKGAAPAQVHDLIGKGDDFAAFHAAFDQRGMTGLLEVIDRARRSFRALEAK